jgi:Tfp pilus assembly protein PilF
MERSGKLPTCERFYIENRNYSLDPASIEKTMASYRNAVKNSPGHTATRNNLAQLLLELKRYPEALVHLEELRRTDDLPAAS